MIEFTNPNMVGRELSLKGDDSGIIFRGDGSVDVSLPGPEGKDLKMDDAQTSVGICVLLFSEDFLPARLAMARELHRQIEQRAVNRAVKDLLGEQ